MVWEERYFSFFDFVDVFSSFFFLFFVFSFFVLGEGERDIFFDLFFHVFFVFLTTIGPHHFWPRPPLGPLADQTVLCPNLCEPSLTPKKPWPMGLLSGTICCSSLVFWAMDHPARDPLPQDLRDPPLWCGCVVVVMLCYVMLCCGVVCCGVSVCVQNFRGCVQDLLAPPDSPSAGPPPPGCDLLRPSSTLADLFFYSGQSYLGQAYVGQPLFRPGLSTI